MIINLQKGLGYPMFIVPTNTKTTEFYCDVIIKMSDNDNRKYGVYMSQSEDYKVLLGRYSSLERSMRVLNSIASAFAKGLSMTVVPEDNETVDKYYKEGE